MLYFCFVLALLYWGRGGVAVSALDVRSEDRWFEAQSLPSSCFVRQDTLLNIVSLHPASLASHPGGCSNTLSCFMLQKPG